MPSTGSVLLDSSVAIAHLRGISAVSERLATVDSLYLPLIALGELCYGISRSSQPERNLAALRRWLGAVALLTLTEATCDCYAKIKEELARAGTPIPENDIWIAASAFEHALPLAARDQHFAQVNGLTVLDWR